MLAITPEVQNKLASIVDECRGCYANQDYPFDQVERVEAGNVQAALRSFGFELSLADAAAVWEHYSLALQAGWMAGAETVKSAGECLVIFVGDALQA